MANEKYTPYASRFVPIQQFWGGQSSDEAIGTQASFSYSKAMEHRKNPSQLTVLPGPRKISAGVVNDLILNMVQVKSGTRYGYGDQGYVYKIDTSNVVTYAAKLPTGSDGMVYRSDNDALYFATQSDVRRMYPMSGTPALDQSYGVSKSIDSNAYRTGGDITNGYTVPITLDEGQAAYFQPDIEPFYSMKVKVVTKGTGNLVLKLHDGLNNELASVTLTNAQFATGLVEFVFSSQIRALVKPNARTYHFHLTSSVADTVVAASTAASPSFNQLNTADFELWAYRLVTTVNGFHPMAQFEQFILIGNGNYLAVWEPLTDSDPPNNEFQRHRLVFPAGYEVCGIAVTDEFTVIACAKYSTDGTKDFQSGKLFTWDGTAQTYNQIVDVSAGAPEGIQSYGNYPYFMTAGKLCAWAGGKEITVVRKIASLDNTYSGVIDNTRVYPNMLCVKDNLLHLGYPSTTSNTTIEHGVYVWGALEKNYPASFNYGYVASHQTNLNTSGNLKIGCVRSFGDEMYSSWKDSTGGYGLDIVDSLCTPAPIFSFRTRRFDAGAAHKDKQALRQAVATAALPSGVTLTAVSKIDGGSYISGLSAATGGEKFISPIATPNQFKRLIIGFDGTCTAAATTPTIYSQVLEYAPLSEQKAL